MTELPLDTFLYRYGVRTLGGLTTPRTFEQINWSLPKNVILHYLPDDIKDLGPTSDFWALRGFPRQSYVYHIEDMLAKEGNPRFRSAININNLIRQFHVGNRKFLRVTKLDNALMSKRYPFIANYAYPPLRYIYQNTPWARVYRFNNMWETCCITANELANKSDRIQLMFFRIPANIPVRARFHSVEEAELTAAEMGIGTSSEFKVGERPLVTFKDLYAGLAESLERTIADAEMQILNSESFDETELGFGNEEVELVNATGEQTSLEAWSRVNIGWFPDDDSMRLVDLWRWLGEKREDSKLNKIAKENYSKIVFVFTVGGRYSLIPMQSLEEWREKAGDTSIAARFHAFMTSLSSFLQLDEKDLIVETVPESLSEKARTVGIIPSGDTDNSIVAGAEVSPNAITGTPVAIGKRQLSLIEDSANLNEIDSENITEIDGETLDTLPVETSVKVAVNPKKQELDPVVLVDNTNPLEAAVATKARRLLTKGLISQAEYQRHIKLSQKYKTLKVDNETLDVYSAPQPAVWNFKPKVIPDIKDVPDKGMLKSSLINYDRDYIEKVMEHETAMMCLQVQRAAFSVTTFEKEPYTDALSKTFDYKFKVVPPGGAESTVAFQLPRIDKNGKFQINGVRYYMRKLRSDKPIRKINPRQVALTTYYPTKLFIERCTKKTASFDDKVINMIASDLVSENSKVTQAAYGNSYLEKQPVPRMYSAIAQVYVEFTLGGIDFKFVYEEIGRNFPEFKGTANENSVPVGRKGNSLVFMDRTGELLVDGRRIPSIIEMLGGKASDLPIEQVMIKILGENIPLGIFLAYALGINGLVKLLNPTGEYPRRRIKGAKRDTTENEYEIVFADEVWVFPRETTKSSLIWGSLLAWKNSLKTMQVADLNERENFFTLFVDAGLSVRYLNEIENILDLFIDPISLDLLKEMQEPTEVVPLFARAAEMLVTDVYDSELDTSLTVIKGYERMNGQVYRTLCESIRAYRNKPVSSRAALDVNPFDVLTKIQQDPSVSLVEDSNVIHNLKEKENMTYSGTGGRNKRGMVRRTRGFHSSDIGIRSEAGVDSGDVGINMYMTADPNITSLRGTVKTVDPTKVSPTQVISTSMLISPFAEYDDGKRVNFINIQQDHVIAIDGSCRMPVRTGYDSVVAHRADDLFSATAEQDGKVVAVTDKVITVEYKDGSKESVRLGRRFGVVTGHSVPHMVRTSMKVGDKFSAGALLAYNEGFFTPDGYFKSGTLAYTALVEKNETWEDSSLVSPELAAMMMTTVGHTRVVFAKFTDEIYNLIKVGDEVDIDTILAVIQDKNAATSVNESSMDALNLLARPTPRAEHEGKVEQIEVIYFGDKDDMSPSIRKIADKYDKERAELVKAMGTDDAKTGEITSPARIEGISIDIDMIAIRIYITEKRVMSGGDKLTLSNQLKSVIAGEQKGPTVTATEIWPGGGTRKIDLEFSYRAEEARIVHSSILAGLSIICQEFIGWTGAKVYFGG